MSKSHAYLIRDSAMNVASVRSISSHPPYFGKPICSSQSSLIRISRDKVCSFGRILNATASFNTSLHAVPNGNYFGETRRTGVQWCNRSLRWDPYKFHDKKSN